MLRGGGGWNATAAEGLNVDERTNGIPLLSLPEVRSSNGWRYVMICPGIEVVERRCIFFQCSQDGLSDARAARVGL